jgi:hypothetical protein
VRREFQYLVDDHGFLSYLGDPSTPSLTKILKDSSDLVVYRSSSRWVVIGADFRERELGVDVHRRFPGKPLQLFEPGQITLARLYALTETPEPGWMTADIDDFSIAVKNAAAVLKAAAPQVLEGDSQVFEDARREFDQLMRDGGVSDSGE